LSPANVDFLLKENIKVNPNIVEVNPNSIQPVEESLSTQKRISIRAKYNIPLNSIVFIYGGNLGKPQGIDFIIKALSANNGIENIFIIVVGSGTEFPRLYEWFKLISPSNILVMQGLPKNEYDELVMACDIGLVFLDRRFSIPNFPSRLLSYLENKMPVLAATDVNTDFGKIIVNAEFGFWVESGDLDGFNNKIQRFIADPKIIQYMGENGYQFLLNNYHVKHSFEKIMNRIKYV
jgi:glycosyltransferase involved in cell wall biosynthesis